jgi:hydrogenase maturation protease
VTAAGARQAARRVVVIGVGNEFRRDDGIGPEVLSRLQEHAGAGPDAGTRTRTRTRTMVQLVSSDGEPAGMIEAWTGASLAVVVDAVVADPPEPGRMHRIVIGRDEAADAHAVSSHGLGVGEAIGLAAVLGRMPDQLIVHAVEAADVGHGVGLTPAVAAVAATLTAAVLRDVQAALRCGAPSAH